jgi:hypothetical protein
MVPRGLAQQLEEVEGSPGGMDGTETQVVQQGRELGPEVEVVVPDQEKLELAKIKRFCSSILKALAPPLLSEFERTTGLRADAEPFTPRRVTRRSMAERAGTQVKMASAAESTLLKALGFCPENLAVSDGDLRRFQEFFDSPVREPQLSPGSHLRQGVALEFRGGGALHEGSGGALRCSGPARSFS